LRQPFITSLLEPSRRLKKGMGCPQAELWSPARNEISAEEKASDEQNHRKKRGA